MNGLSMRVIVLFLGMIGLLGGAVVVIAQPEAIPPSLDQETDVARLTQILKDGNEEARQNAVRRLSEIGDPKKILEPLLFALNDASENVRWYAANSMQDHHTPEAAVPLLKLLQEGREEIRPQVVRALGKNMEAPVTEALLAELKKGDPAVCTQVAISLEGRDDPHIRPALLAATRSDKPGARAAAASVLRFDASGEATRRIVELLTDPEPSVRMSAMQAIAWAAEQRNEVDRFRDAIQPLIKQLADENMRVRYWAVIGLGKLRNPDAVPALIQALNDPENQVQYEVVRALGRLRDARAVKPLLELGIVDGDKSQFDIPGTLSRIGKQAVPIVIEVYDQAPDVARRRAILQMTKQITAAGIFGFFQRVLVKETDADLRLQAIQALRNNYDPRAVPTLVAVVRDVDLRVRAAAVGALIRNTREAKVIDALLPLLKDPVKEVRYAAAQALQGLDDARVTTVLIEMSKDTDARTRARAMQLLRYNDPLEIRIEATRDESAEVRKAAVQSLVWTVYWNAGQEAKGVIISALIERLKDQDGNVRQETVQAMGRIPDARIITALADTMLHDTKAEVRESAAGALGIVGDDRGVEPLMQAILDPVEWARSAAKDALGRIGDKRAIPALIAIRNSGDEGDRGRTAGALAKLGVTEDIFVPKEFSKEEWAIVAPAFGRDWLSKDEILALQAQKPKFAAILKAFLEHSTTEDGMQQRAMETLVTLQAPGTAEILANFDTRMRNKGEQGWFAVWQLSLLHDPRAIQPLIDRVRLYMAQDNLSQCDRLLKSLAEYDDPRIAPLMKECLGSEEMNVKYIAAGALGRRGDAEAMALLMTPLEELGWREKLSALGALGQTGDPRALEILLRELESPDFYSVTSAAEALSDWLKARAEDTAYDRIAQAILKHFPPTGDNYQRLALLKLLTDRQDPRAIDPLLAMMKQRKNGDDWSQCDPLCPLLQYRGDKIVNAILPVLANGDPSSRAQVITALGNMADPRAVPALLDSIKNDTTLIRLKAIKSLGQLKATGAVATLIPLLDEPGTRVRTAAAQALKAITGQVFGEDVEKWREWWRGQRGE